MQQLNIDIPLYYNNKGHAVRFDFEDVTDKAAPGIIQEILRVVFGDRDFWICEYGCRCAADLCDKHFFREGSAEIEVIPHEFPKDDWFEYFHNSIVCARVNARDFIAQNYIKYALRRIFMSNTIFLIDDHQKIALHIYDRRGMDVASADDCIILRLIEEFRPYVYHDCHPGR